MPQTATVRVYQLRFGCRRPCRRRRGMGRGLPRRRPMQQSPSCSKTGWPRPLIATWNGWPHAARPTAATALTRAGCSPSSACSSCTCHDPPNYDDARLVNFAAVPGQNAMYVSGAAPHVQKTVSVLLRADRRTAHILLETLVVEFATGALDRFNASIQNAVTGQFSDIDVVPGDPLFPSITFSFLEGTFNPTQLTALIDLFVDQDKAQIISRPYVATLSGEEAMIKMRLTASCWSRTSKTGRRSSRRRRSPPA